MCGSAGRGPPRTLQRLDVRRRGTLLSLRDFEGHLLALFQRLEPRALNSAVMREEVLTAAVRRNEAVALRIVEPLNRTCRHVVPFPEIEVFARGCPSPLRARSREVIDGHRRAAFGGRGDGHSRACDPAGLNVARVFT